MRAVRRFSSGLLSSFHALLQIWPVGIRSLAHWRTKMSSPLGAAGRNCSQGLCLTIPQSTRLFFSCVEQNISISQVYGTTREIFSGLTLSRSGIMALMALTRACLIPRCERLAKGLECCLISSPKFPIVCSRVH